MNNKRRNFLIAACVVIAGCASPEISKAREDAYFRMIADRCLVRGFNPNRNKEAFLACAREEMRECDRAQTAVDTQVSMRLLAARPGEGLLGGLSDAARTVDTSRLCR